MASAIERIGNALRYDAAETAILTSFADALRIAAMSAELIPVDADVSPESYAYTVRAPEAVTVRPGKAA